MLVPRGSLVYCSCCATVVVVFRVGRLRLQEKFRTLLSRCEPLTANSYLKTSNQKFEVSVSPHNSLRSVLAWAYSRHTQAAQKKKRDYVKLHALHASVKHLIFLTHESERLQHLDYIANKASN